jgi:hypothetical protein
MPLAPDANYSGQPLRVFTTPDDLGGGALGMLVLTLDPLRLYVETESGWVALASLEGAEPPPLGNHNLFSISHPDVDASDTPAAGEILTYDGSTWKAGPPVPAATETAPGKVELATAAETATGTDTSRAVHPAGLKSTLTPETPITPTLTNGWIAYGSPYLGPGYYKDASGRVHLQGTVKNGGLNTTNPIFTLPVGYRPSADLSFSVDGSGFDPWRITVQSDGKVFYLFGGTNTRLSFNGVYFRAA